MTSIIKATLEDFELLAEIGKQTFIESHGKSAAKEDIDSYASKNYTPEVFQQQLNDPKNIYHLVCYEGKPAGYSKIILDCPQQNITLQNITKLERLYLLQDFYDLKLGQQLFRFNIELSKNCNQAGIWLFVWKDNHRAVNFYIKNGFEVIGSHDFRISDTHSNPNHQMFLRY